jgi:hypothetical protein
MAKKKPLKDLTYEEKEQVLLQKLHAYRTMQVDYETHDYHMSYMEKLINVKGQVDYCLSFMDHQGGPGSVEELAREQRKQEREFYKANSSANNRNYLVQIKFTKDIRDAVDAKLGELGFPVFKPSDNH